MTEQELLQDCLRRLNDSFIEYMLVGSMASNYWEIPRSTHDIDFVIQYSDADISQIVQLFDGGVEHKGQASLERGGWIRVGGEMFLDVGQNISL